MYNEVGRWHVGIRGYVEQVTNASSEPRFLEELALTGSAKALAFFHASTGKHAVMPTVLDTIDHEQALVSDDDGC